MERAVVVRGRLCDPRHIELDEPIVDIQGSVELVVRGSGASPLGAGRDVFDLIATLPPGGRTREDIDRQVQEDRDSWGNR